MTDHMNGFYVALTKECRVDDGEALMSVIRRLQGVAAVTPHVTTWEDFTASSQANIKWRTKILALLELPI